MAVKNLRDVKENLKAPYQWAKAKMTEGKGRGKLAEKMLKRMDLESSSTYQNSGKIGKTLKDNLKKGDMIGARKYLMSQRAKANKQGWEDKSRPYTME